MTYKIGQIVPNSNVTMEREVTAIFWRRMESHRNVSPFIQAAFANAGTTRLFARLAI